MSNTKDGPDFKHVGFNGLEGIIVLVVDDKTGHNYLVSLRHFTKYWKSKWLGENDLVDHANQPIHDSMFRCVSAIPCKHCQKYSQGYISYEAFSGSASVE